MSKAAVAVAMGELALDGPLIEHFRERATIGPGDIGSSDAGSFAVAYAIMRALQIGVRIAAAEEASGGADRSGG